MKRCLGQIAPLSLVIVAFGLGASLPSHAQNKRLVVRDGSIGGPGGIVAPGIDDLGQPADYLIRADLGQQRGGNLFHSFERFSIGTGETVTFTDQGQLAGQPPIDNVISRVTQEDSVSEIDGTLRSTIPGADVWLMNPNGIVFGSNARLDVPAGFHASTADHLNFGEDGIFSATQPHSSVLSVSPPESFGFLEKAPGTMIIESTLKVDEGETLSLVGGDIELTRSALSAPGGLVNVASVAARSEVVIDQLDQSLRFTPEAPETPDGGQLTLHDARIEARADTTTSRGIRLIAAESVEITGASLISGSTIGTGDAGAISIESPVIRIDSSEAPPMVQSFVVSESTNRDEPNAGNAGNIELLASDSVVIVASVIRSATFGAGGGGDLSIESPFILLMDSTLDTRSADGEAGNLHLSAAEAATIADSLIETVTFGRGDAGAISIESPVIAIDSSRLNSSSQPGASGNGGDIRLLATESGSVTITSRTDISASTLRTDISASTSGAGQAGAISVEGRTIVIDTSSLFTAAFAGTGDAGDIHLSAAESITISGPPSSPGQIFAAGLVSGTLDQGKAGSIVVKAPRIALRDGGRIETNTQGQGDAGSVQLVADELVEVRGVRDQSVDPRAQTGVSSDSRVLFVGGPGGGSAGSISIMAPRIVITDGGIVRTNTETVGAGGTIGLTADVLEMTNGGAVSAVSSGEGLAGSIEIDVGDTARLVDSSITAAATMAFGGSISINGVGIEKSEDGRLIALPTTGKVPGFLVHLVDSEITTSVGEGEGDGGNVLIEAVFLILQGSRIEAKAVGGNGGNILLVADFVLADEPLRAIVDASSDAGVSGTVDVQSPDVDLVGGLVALPDSALDASDAITPPCSARRRGETPGSFVFSGRQGVPPGPEGALAAWPGDVPSSAAGGSGSVMMLADGCR